MFSRILLASDGSDHALKAARAAGEMALKFGSRLVMVSVFAPPVPIGSMVIDSAPGLDTDVFVRLCSDVQDAVERRTGQILDELNVAYECRREVGHPAEVIVDIAAHEKADLIVLGSRGLGGVKSFLLGSISDRVMHHAHCPVLIVK